MPDQHLKDLVKTIADLMLLIGNVESNGFSFSEVGEIITLIGDGKTLIADAPFLLDEYKDLNDAAKADLISYIQANVQFPPNANVADVVQKILELAVSVSGVFALFK